MTWIAVAVGGSALIGAGTSLYAGSQASGAARDAAKVQADAATLASDRALAQYTDTKNNLSPFISAGTEALGTAKNLLGLGTQGQAGINDTFVNTPGYAFTLDQGLKSTQNSYAAQGLGSSGAALKGAAQFATGLASTTYEQRLQDYLGLAGSGQQAAEAQGQQGITSTNAANNFSTSGAAATGAGIVGGTNALNAGITGAGTSIGSGGITAALLPQILANNNTNANTKNTNPLSLSGHASGTVTDVSGTALDPTRSAA